MRAPELPRGELNQPHALAMDSKGRLFVGSRSSNCVQIFDQDGKFIDQWSQFSRPSGVFIDKDDILYVADSESGPSNNTTHPGGWQRGIRIGSAKDGKVKSFIPDPDLLRHAARAPRKASPSMRAASSTAPKSARWR